MQSQTQSAKGNHMPKQVYSNLVEALQAAANQAHLARVAAMAARHHAAVSVTVLVRGAK